MSVRRRFERSRASLPLLRLCLLTSLINPAIGQGWVAVAGAQHPSVSALRASPAQGQRTSSGWGAGSPETSIRRPHPDWGLTPPKSNVGGDRNRAPFWSWPDLRFPGTQSRPPVSTSRPRTLIRTTPIQPAATVQANVPPQVRPRRNSVPAVTSYVGAAGKSESSADDYGQNFGSPDETLPSAGDDLGDEEFDIDEIDFSQEPGDTTNDDVAQNNVAPETSHAVADMNTPATGPEIVPPETGDTSSPVDAGPPKDKGPTTKDTGAGEELGTTAPPTSTGPEDGSGNAGGGPKKGSSGGNETGLPVSGGGWGNGAPSRSDDRWMQPPNPGPGLNGYEPKPGPERFDPKRPGQGNWEWSIDRDPFADQRHPFTNEPIIDPKTGRETHPAGVGVQWNVGHPQQRNVPRQNGPRENTLPYYNALPPVPEQQPPAQDADSLSPTSSEPPWDPANRSSGENEKQKVGPGSSDAHRSKRLHDVKVTAGDGMTQATTDAFEAVTGVDLIKTMQQGAQTVIDAVETGVESVVNATRLDDVHRTDSQPEQAGGTADRGYARSEQDRRAREQQEFDDKQREREAKVRKEERFRAAEKSWQAAEGAEFGKTHGPRPKDPEQAQQWDRERTRAIRNYRQKRLDVKIELESTVSESSLRW